MSLRRLTYLACDVCGDPQQPHDDAAEARRVAKIEGWRRLHEWDGHGHRLRPYDVCPHCVPLVGDSLVAAVGTGLVVRVGYQDWGLTARGRALRYAPGW